LRVIRTSSGESLSLTTPELSTPGYRLELVSEAQSHHDPLLGITEHFGNPALIGNAACIRSGSSGRRYNDRMIDAENDLLTRILDEVVHGREAVEDRIDGVASEIAGLRREMLSHFDAVYARFDRKQLDAKILELEKTS
jgi:hypothetical protein